MFTLAIHKDDICDWGDTDTTNEVMFARLLGWMANMGCGEDLAFPLFAASNAFECKHDIEEYCNDDDCADQISNFVMFNVEEIPA